MKDSDKFRINRIIEHCDALHKEINGFKINELFKDEILFKAVKLDVMLIGEHIKYLPSNINEYLGIKETSDIVHLRNTIVHTYNFVKNEAVEDAINIVIPKLFKQLIRLKEKNYYVY